MKERTSLLCLALGGVLILVACGDDDGPRDPRIDALWAEPARCDAPAYHWLDDPTLGQVVDWGEEDTLRYDRTTIRASLALADAHFTPELRYDTRLFQYRYVTQDRGALTEATSILAVPEVGDGDPSAFPVIVFIRGTSGFNDDCAPSNAVLYPVVAAALASVGYLVVAPDLIGLMGRGAPSTQIHPYLIGEPTALATLDAVRGGRALLAQSLHLGVSARPGLLVMGASQGGHGALFTGLYGPYYAPEEKILGVAASVPPSDLLHQGIVMASGWEKGTDNFVAILAAMADWYHMDLSEALLPPYDTEVPERMQTECQPGDLVPDATSVEGLFTPALRDLASQGFPAGESRWSCVLRENSLPYTSVEPLSFPPTLVVHAEQDNLVNTAVERDAFETLCSLGYRLEYLECAGMGHAEAGLSSFGEQLDFLMDRYDGVPWPDTDVCQLTAPVTCGDATSD